MADQKYTLGESLIIAPIVGVMAVLGVSLVTLLMIPVELGIAWIRVQLWDWFVVPYFHAPHVGVWLMYAVGLLIGSFTYNSSNAKDKEKAWISISAYILTQIMVLAIGYGIHRWILK